jgi:hypothetical protein
MHAGETSTARLWIDGEGILQIALHRRAVIKLADAEAIMTEAVRAVGERCVPVLIDLGRIDSMSRPARTLLGRDGAEVFSAQALLVGSRVSRSIASYMTGLAAPPFPAKIFQARRAAAAWLLRQRARGDER